MDEQRMPTGLSLSGKHGGVGEELVSALAYAV